MTKISGFERLLITISVGRRLDFDFCKNGNWDLNSNPFSSEKMFKTGGEFLFIDKTVEKISSPDISKIDKSGINFLGLRDISKRKSNSYLSSKFWPFRKMMESLFKNFAGNRPYNLSNSKINNVKTYVGRYATSMEMAGMSITTLKLNDDLKKCLFASSTCPFWNN